MLVALSARGFRNLQPLLWPLEAGSNLLLGDNGAGKTSLLEAVYLLASTKSFRTTHLIDCRQHGTETFDLQAEIDEQARTKLAFSWGPTLRQRLVNGREVPLVEHLSVLPLVIWTSLDAEAFSGEPRLRRRLLDRGLVGWKPSCLTSLSRYKRALAAKRGALAGSSAELSTWNTLVAETAAEVIAYRRSYHETLSSSFTQVLAESGLDLPGVSLEYRCSPSVGLEGRDAIEEALSRVSEQERRRGEALIGPHRDDWLVRLRGAELKRVASAGERRALGLLLAIAHGRLLSTSGRQPLYLLDDVDAELSESTLGAIWKTLHLAPQVLLTSSRPRIWQQLPIEHRWSLSGGSLSTL